MGKSVNFQKFRKVDKNSSFVETRYMRYFLLILLTLGFSALLWTNPKKKTADTQEKETLTLWEGELSAIYKDKGKIIVQIPYDPEWIGKDFSEIKQSIEQIQSFPIRQKVTNKRIGDFVVRYIELSQTFEKMGRKEHEIVLYGKLNLRKSSYDTLISNDFYISLTRKEISYEDPSAFFKEKPTPPKSSIIHPNDKKEMVLIPSGLFIHGQGLQGHADDYNPAFQSPGINNIQDLPSFYIDKYEVTNLEYDRFLKATGNAPPKYWVNGEIPEGKLDHPVISLTYREVESYAKWAGKRLPTELEWEKAARGPGVKVIKDKKENLIFEIDTIAYPYGKKYDPKLCNCLENGSKDTISVYELPTKGASVYGVMGMCGNAPEWTSSWYAPYENHFFESSLTGKVVKVVRGGAFFEGRKKCTVFARSYGGLPNLSEDRRAGFRLVIDKD
jgi:formylglycine-generating enzyme required for sulfatase activity